MRWYRYTGTPTIRLRTERIIRHGSVFSRQRRSRCSHSSRTFHGFSVNTSVVQTSRTSFVGYVLEIRRRNTATAPRISCTQLRKTQRWTNHRANKSSKKIEIKKWMGSRLQWGDPISRLLRATARCLDEFSVRNCDSCGRKEAEDSFIAQAHVALVNSTRLRSV